MTTSLKQFMAEVGKHSLLTPAEEQASFKRLDELKDLLIVEINKSSILYHKVPSILFLLADGYEAIKNIIQPHKHDLKTKQLTEYAIQTLEEYQSLYQQKVIQKKPELKEELDKLTLALAFDPIYVEQLAQEVQMYTDGDALVDMHMTDVALLDTQYAIAAMLSEVRRIKQHIVACNLRLVVKLARKLYRDGSPLSLEDLIQEGNIGLMKAVERFDVETGNRFSTMATWWVNQSIIRYMQNNGRTIRVPVNVQDHLNKAIKIFNKLQAQYKRAPTDREMATMLGISIDRYKELQEAMTTTTSIDAPAGGEEDSQMTLADVIADAAQAVDVEIYSEQVQLHVHRALELLPERERDVIKLRYGFDDDEMTLGEIAVVIGMTKPSVMNYENRALLKMHRYLVENLKTPE